MVSKRSDGYHNLNTIFYPIELCDVLEIVESEKTEISISGIEIGGNPENNLVFKAYTLLKENFQIPNVAIHLYKNIPFGAGLGGGSSDAAFTLLMLNQLFQLKLTKAELIRFALKIGADCPFFLYNKPCFASGIGNVLKPVSIDLSKFIIVVLKPQVFVSTKEAYQNIIPEKPGFNLQNLGTLAVEEWKNAALNNFEKHVFILYPEIAKLKQILYGQGALYASMSGSGSAVFGIFRRLPADFDKFIPTGIYIYR